jgi:hypothetical protein
MIDVVTYFVTFAAETADALFGKLYDPVAWFGLIGALLLGSTISRQRTWMAALGWGVLVFAVLMLGSTYRGSEVSVTRGDRASLAFICVMGWLIGSLLGSWFSRRSA